MTSPDFGRITELKDDPVLSMPSIRPLSRRPETPAIRHAEEVDVVDQTQCGPACGASCSHSTAQPAAALAR